MKVTVKKTQLEALSSRLGDLAKQAPEKLERACAPLAEDMTVTAKGLVYQNGLAYRDGAIRDSLHGFTQREGDQICLGVRTALDIAIYHEMGTGPVGTAAGYPGEAQLSTPVVRRSSGWTYWSREVQEQRAAEQGGGQEANGFVYTEGVPPKAFMHNALLQHKEEAAAALTSLIREELTP